MNIEIANRLLEYRKQMGLSQEELAEKLGISRQSVSKWERAEASPDTDNLIELSKIYNVTLDELLNGKQEINEEPIKEEIKKESDNGDNIEFNIGKLKVNINGATCEDTDDDNHVIITKENVTFKNLKSQEKEVISWDDVYTKNSEGEIVPIEDMSKILKSRKLSLKAKNIKNAINSALILIITALYVTLCAIFQTMYDQNGVAEASRIFTWDKFWVIFISYPALSTLVDAIFHKKASDFAYPVLLAFVYATLGMYFGLWHPYWCIFITIPVYYVIVNALAKKYYLYFKDQYGNEHSFVYKHHDYEFEVRKIKEDDSKTRS